MGARIGQRLSQKWKLGVKHALYHKDGTWYHRLTRFPGALCDPFGYVIFKSEADFANCPYLRIGQDVAVKDHLSDIPGYVRVPAEAAYREVL
jgi:5-methylcytosine-specific restriction protein A